MISNEQVAHIRHLFHAEHWKVGTIAAELHLHPDTVRIALDTDRFRSHPRLRDRLTDPYLGFLRQTLQQYPRLRATRLFHMIRPRDDDHFRNLEAWRNIRAPSAREGTLPYVRVDVRNDAITEFPNPCPTAQDVYRLHDLDWV